MISTKVRIAKLPEHKLDAVRSLQSQLPNAGRDDTTGIKDTLIAIIYKGAEVTAYEDE